MKEHTGNIKVLLILIAMIISIAAGEAAVLVACLALSACVDEIRIQILFKERRELTNTINKLWLSSNIQTGEIKTLQGLSREVKGEVETQTDEIETLQGLSRKLEGKVNIQTGKIETLQGLSREVKGEVETQTGKIETLQEKSQQVRKAVNTQTSEIGTLQEKSRELEGKVNIQTREINKLIWATGKGAIIGVILTVVFGILGLFSDEFLTLLIGIHNWLQSL